MSTEIAENIIFFNASSILNVEKRSKIQNSLAES